MASSNVCWGIEIGAYAVKALKLEVADQNVNVLDYAIIPHAKVLSTPGVDQNDVVRVTLGTLVAQWDLSKAAIAISVPGQASLARFAKLPPVEPRRVPDIVKFEAAQQIPFPLDQVEWDYQTFVSPDSPDIEVGIFAITRERIMDRLLQLQDVGITPDHVTLSPIAAFNAMAFDKQFTEKTPGTVLLDIGTTSTDVVVADAGRVWVRTVPLGGHHFTEALVNAFKLSYPKAEKLKKEVESGTNNSKHIAQAMRPVFSDLAQEVQRSIGYYQSLHKDAKLTRLIGMGSTFLMPGIRKFLKQQLSASVGPMEVMRVEEFDRLKLTGLGDERRAEEFRNNLVSMTTCYGLALQGLGMNTVNANLMPVEIIRKSVWKEKSGWFIAAAGLAVAASAAMFIRPVRDNFAVVGSQPAPVIENVLREASQLKSAAEEAGVIGSASVDNRPLNMLALLDNRDMYSYILGDLSKMLEDAQSKVASNAQGDEATAYVLRSFRTTYRAGGTQVSSEFGGGLPASAGSGNSNVPMGGGERPYANPHGGGGHGGGGGEEARINPETGLPEEEGGAEKRIIDCELVVTTTQPDAQKFMLATIDRWLRDNKVRKDMPYTLHVEEIPWKMQSEQGTDASGRSFTPGTAPRRESASERIARERPDVKIIGAGPSKGGGGHGEEGGAPGYSGPLPSFDSLRPQPKAGAIRTTFIVKWSAEITPPKAAGEEAGADAASGGGA
ncbi:MAG TPA: type IV pilus assembly protein PilM [Phycisphaerales bacterium]|nr:type IV pilus assembly protein PilM [Phycisphaerales bacterium]